MVEKNRQNVLILDHERDTAELFTRALESHYEGYKCYWVENSEQARSLLCEIPFVFVLADVSILEEDHFMLLNLIQEMGHRTVVIVDAYLSQKNNIKKAMEMGASGYFIKPVMVSALRKLIDDFSVRP